MVTVNLQYSSLSQINSSDFYRLKIVAMTCRVYMGEVLIKVWLRSIKK